ncbi:class I SAM-dependent methyltransferase [Amaricoccus solimangrovi]|uniref:Class I SAM-dependent methyltransferase n=1 Tax=Amaricoccus solimangrovi TaxID=2589815 RepID=A0A501WJ06_9RHOB|nr:class I SAM-dependent methyltransferase [Amaricoccus solimangrovi]TPE48415.1 class I SAM-dependent methyltransferase [Amaricoccus solimangrovi]
MYNLKCRFCDAPISETFIDLGTSPIANSYVKPENFMKMEPFFALHAFVCGECFLVQLPNMESREHIFNEEYAYFSSYSASVLAHSKAYVEMMIERFGFDAGSQVIEVASNDGYLLKYFQERGVKVLGIEPSGSVAEAAEKAGIPSRVRFFGVETAKALREEGFAADLMLGNNVMAHVPDLNDFIGGFPILVRPGGIVTIEFPHLLRTIEDLYYDQVYHEHYSYLSLVTVEKIFAAHGMTLFDVEEIAPQGGSLRIFACHAGDAAHPVTERVAALRAREIAAGLTTPEGYRTFAERVRETKRDLLRFLMEAKEAGKTVVGYGAPAKATTLLNYCGVKTDMIDYTVDISPYKHGRLLPGTRIPIHPPERILETKPDYVLILAWNIKDEITRNMAAVRDWGGRFVVPLPRVEVLD